VTSEEPLIAILPAGGRMANRMFQVMLAHEIHRRAGVGQIVGCRLPRWGLVSALPDVAPEPFAVLMNHAFDLDHVAYLLRSGMLRSIVIQGWGMRLAYYGSPEPARQLFQTPASGHALRDDELLIHVRAGDILDLHHPYYFPMPFSFYEEVIATTGLSPVFLGQLGDDSYSDALRRRFAGAKFLARRSTIEDFTTIRQAPHVVLSVSSYSWLAAWLSETAQSIHMPIYGLFDPRNGQTFLLPVDDPRWRFYAVDVPERETHKGLDVVDWAQRTASLGRLDEAQVRTLAIHGISTSPSAVLASPE
jgi:hypothetical protein